MRVATNAEKEFSESDLAAKLSAKAELRKNVYEDFSRYVDSQKEFLDKMLDEYSQSYNEAKHILDKHRRSFVLTKVESVLSAVGEKIE
jgi:peptide subunit release factor 1 (eRF1)